MAAFLRKRWFLLLVLIVFVICKVPHLFYPYYWDESWVYVPAIKEMYHNGVSLLPNAMDEYFSRGHPLLFHALGASWIHIFGSSHFSLHSFGLLISLCMLCVVYEAGLKMFNARVGAIALLLVATQVCFFVQSSFVLPEILVALLAFLSLFFYVHDKYLLTGLCLSLLFLTKESGIVAGVVIGLDALIGLIAGRDSLRTRILRILPVSVAILVIVSFFLLQKIMKGWYLFPSHIDTIITSFDAYIYRFRNCCLKDVFAGGLRYYLYLLLVLLSVIVSVRTRNLRWLAVIIPATLIYVLVDDARSITYFMWHFYWAFAIFIVCFCVTVFVTSSLFEDRTQRRFFILAALFVLCFISFSSLLTYTLRYIFAAMIPMLFITAALIELAVRRTSRVLFYPVLAVILIVAFFSFKTNTGTGDCDLGAFTAMRVQQGVVNFMEQNAFYDKHVCSESFLEREHLVHPNTGFLHSDHAFTHLSALIDSTTDIIIVDNIEPDPRYKKISNDTAFHLLNRITDGSVWAEIYGKK